MEEQQDKESQLEEAIQLWVEMKQVNRKKGWDRLITRLPEAGNRKRSILRLGWFGRTAAVAGLFVLLGSICYLWMQPEKVERPLTVVAIASQPRLILDNGQQISLEKSENPGEMAQVKGVVIDRQTRNVIYTTPDAVPARVLEYNTLEIPRGSEYKLTLADGTQVWLNAETRLRYPVNFGSAERRVYLEGEAYFEVSKDAERPFRVESFAQTVEVLGTQFNVYAYTDEQQLYTTLVEGSVAVKAAGSGKQMKLKPGEQAVLQAQDGSIAVGKVNIEEVVYWKDGIFVFDDQTLETILKKVVRWYDVEVFYRNNSAKKLVFKGNLPRYAELPQLLKILENTGQVRFSLKERSLVVE